MGRLSERFWFKFLESIIRLMKENSSISALDISQTINLSSRAVENKIMKLKSKRVLERIGPDKGGYWKILDE